MEQGCDALKWSPRLSKEKLRRLYLTEAKGIYDNKLIDDVGMSLYMRCRDILTVKMAREDKKVRCPVCDDAQKETLIPRRGGRREKIKCPVCGWKILWEDYLKTVKRKQLNAGGAVKAFEAFMRNYENANSVKEKMLSIDRLLHEFHYSVKEQPDQPTRPVGVNLITGNLKSVIEFLDKLTSGEFCAPELKETKVQWDKNLHDFENINWKSIVDKKRNDKGSDQ